MITIIALGPVEMNSNGYSIRIEHLINSLSQFGEVSLIEFDISEPRGVADTTYQRVEYDAVYRNRPRSELFNRLVTFNPFGQLKMQLVTLRGLWEQKDLVKRSEVVFIEGALFPFAIVLAKLLGKTIVLDTHCVNLKLAFDFKSHNRSAYVLRRLGWSPLEYFAYRFSDHIIFVSENEVDFSERTLHMAREKAIVIPNVLTIPPLEVTEEELDRFRERYGLTRRVVATFLGDLTSVQNKDCADLIVRELAPEVRDRDEIRFLIVGKGADAFQGAPGNVVFTGYLDKIDQVIAATDIFVAPMRVGAGTKTKVLLFMGYGIPILTTKVGIEGIDVRGRDDIQVVEIADFADSLRTFAPRKRADMGGAVNTDAARGYSPEVMRSKIEELMDRIRKAKRPDRHGKT